MPTTAELNASAAVTRRLPQALRPRRRRRSTPRRQFEDYRTSGARFGASSGRGRLDVRLKALARGSRPARSSTVMARRALVISRSPRPAFEPRATDSREAEMSPASSSWESGRSMRETRWERRPSVTLGQVHEDVGRAGGVERTELDPLAVGLAQAHRGAAGLRRLRVAAQEAAELVAREHDRVEEALRATTMAERVEPTASTAASSPIRSPWPRMPSSSTVAVDVSTR